MISIYLDAILTFGVLLGFSHTVFAFQANGPMPRFTSGLWVLETAAIL
jgi:hypothetical protein